MAQFPLTQQIEELETELSSRRVNYPRQVGSGKLRQSEAEYRIARLESAIKTLKWLKDNEEAVRSVAKRETNGTE